jgi:hypothetical protein
VRITLPTLAACALLGPAAWPASAATPCPRAPTVLQPLAGCTLQECKEREFDEAELQAGPLNGSGDFPKKFVEGRLSMQTYTCPAALTVEEIARTSQAALRRSGYAVVYSGQMFVSDLPGFTLRKGGQWVQLATDTFDDKTAYTVTAVAATPPAPARTSTRPRRRP